MTAKQHKARREISLSSKKENENDTKKNTNLDQANNKFSLQL